ncbi:hypothetical protein AK812_SmicGene48382, partial [Symbiodinium microadriaticum]
EHLDDLDRAPNAHGEVVPKRNYNGAYGYR